ncbi:potassium channel family protein [Rhodococcus rhodnii]|uniref:Potassium channel domain-containing protein n=1 Tax=Rhodococcus rhodnii LMG 5362 TaxID=1273125 RepID=R7WTN5_9NOCA|nr:potassium channel family protein [Rhodococcus rhodnii]EOM78617.1 hypothetical protein Rrhod_0006 [Rhodococcus rhodnii LMG 5362]
MPDDHDGASRHHDPVAHDAGARSAVRAVAARSCLTVVAATVVYFTAPVQDLSGVPGVLWLVAGIAIVGVLAWLQLRAITRSRVPALRSLEGAAVVLPVYLLGFATAYYVLAAAVPGSFDAVVTRIGSLYFTLSVFATVGFGDIVAVTDRARALVVVQMIGNLLLLGLGVRVVVALVRWSRDHRPPTS